MLPEGFVAVIVYFDNKEVVEGTPVMEPVVVLNTKPLGRDGVILNVILLPSIIGTI